MVSAGRGGRYDPESWKWVCALASTRIPGLHILITARPNRLEHFGQAIVPPPEKVLVSNLSTPEKCLDTVCRTLQRKLRLGEPIVHNITGDDKHGRLAQKLWDATTGHPNLVAQASLLLLDRGVVWCDPGDSKLRVAVGESESLHIPGLTELVQRRFIQGLSPGSQDVLKCASLMGLIFDHHLLERLPGGDGAWIKESIAADLVVHNVDADTCEFTHASVVDSIYAVLTKVVPQITQPAPALVAVDASDSLELEHSPTGGAFMYFFGNRGISSFYSADVQSEEGDIGTWSVVAR